MTGARNRAGAAFFVADATKQNMAVYELAQRWAQRKDVTPGQFSQARVLARKPWIVPIPGTADRWHPGENPGAAEVRLTSIDCGSSARSWKSCGARAQRRKTETLT